MERSPITVCLPAPAFDLGHRRHFFEAVAKDPEARVVGADEEEIDICFWVHSRAKLSVLWSLSDPHSMAWEIEERLVPFLDERMITVLKPAGFEKVEEYLHSPSGWLADIRKMNPDPQIPGIDKFDVVLVPMFDLFQRTILPCLHHAKLWWKPWGVPGWIFYPPAEDRRSVDVFAGSGGYFYPLRTLMLQRFQQEMQAGLRLHHFPGLTREVCNGFKNDCSAFDAHQKWYADSIRDAKVFAFCPGVCGYPVQKYLEAMACGSLVVAPLPRDAERLGFIDGHTIVDCGPDDFMEKINYYLQHEEERRAITDTAAELVRQKYTCEAQVKDMIGKFKRVLAGEPIESLDGAIT